MTTPLDLETRLAALSPEKQALVRKLLQERAAAAAGAVASIPRAPRVGRLPLSAAQRRMWLLSELEGRGATYNVAAALRLTGALNAEALETALREIVRRHDVLRTTFVRAADGAIEQEIAPEDSARSFQPVTRMVRGTADADPDGSLMRLAEAEARVPFDLASGPLLRATLLVSGPQDHALVLVLHHIVTDGWSMAVLVEELGTLYRAFVAGAPSPLEDLRIQYADYAVWEQAARATASSAGDRAYWRETLADAPSTLELVTDRPRPPFISSRGGTVRFEIAAASMARARALAELTGTSVFAVSLASVAILLGRYTGQDDIVIGCPLANRHRDTERLIGFFVNTLPVRVRLSGAPTFRDAVTRAQQAIAGAIAHQSVPFDRIVDDLKPERDRSRTPLFQAVVAYQPPGHASLRLPDLLATPLSVDTGTSKFELTFVLDDGAGACEGAIEFNADLYDESTARRMADHLRALIDAALAAPDTAIDDLEILSARERRLLLDHWSGSRTDYPRDAAVTTLFDEIATRHAADAALIFGDATLTYGELRRRADRVAVHLHERGVRRGEMVGICAERSLELVVGILGVLKAGAAYVPLDPSYPVERLELMARDAAVRIVLTHGARSVLPAGCTAVEISSAIAGSSSSGVDAAMSAAVGAEDVAYVIYTSGSTGEPKGVRVPHRAIVRLVRGQNFITIDPADTFLQLAPISFDASTLELWGPLLNGGRLVIAPPHQPSGSELGALIRRHGIKTMWLTSSLFNVLVDERVDDLAPVRQLLVGGDVLSVPHVLRAVAALDGGRIINGYGPTENTTFTCCHAIDSRRDYASGIPIGTPIANTTVYVLDPRLRPVPVGVAGELYTGGDGLAHGYLNQPALTAERFIPNPFGAGVLYRTGDAARWLPGGEVQFLGRRDQQVKIRGFRVEPGEIEAVLLRLSGVRQAIVDVRPAAHGGRELVAYVVTDGDPIAASAAAIAARLRAVLPPFMIPSAIVVLESLPLTANGKVNRRRLPDPSRASLAESFVAPRTSSERQVAAIYRDLLAVDRVGVDDDFFALGGNSLVATQLVSRIRKAAGVELPLRQVFDTPDVERLAAAVDAAATPVASATIPRVDRSDSLPLSFAQERLWFLNRLEPDNPFYNVALALQLDGALDAGGLESALRDVVQRHEILRTTYEQVDGRPAQRVQPDTRLTLQVIDLDAGTDADVERLARDEARRPFDLARGPVVRATLLRRGPDRQVLLLTIHHIAADGWSMGVMVNELTKAYARQGTLEPLAIQYADYASWQRGWIDGEVYERQSAYWKRQLEGYPTELSLATDRPRPPAQSFRGGSLRFEIDAETSRRVAALSREHDATPFMTLLAAFSALLSRHARQWDLVIGSPIANRTRSEVEPLVGFFVNTLALRIDLSGDPTFAELVARARRLSLDAYANQDLPFERLVDEIQPQRDLSRNPLFQVMFALQNAPIEALGLPGVRVTPLDLERTSSQFDLVLDMWEREEGLLGILEFSTDLFERSTMQRLIDRFQTLLAGAVAAPQTALSALPLLTEGGRRTLLDDFNAVRADFPIDRTIHQLFEAQVAADPSRIAASHGAARITYGELNARANRIAHRLRRMGVGRNEFVGLLLERDLDCVAAILGVMKAGGAYVPIDPSYPRDRVAFMIEDCAPKVLITKDTLADLHGEASSNPDHLNEPTDRAYMLYTSGSTGQPKGAILRHDGKINHIYAQFRWLEFHADSVFLQTAPSSSDISVWQFLGPLLIGGRTVIVDYETLCDPPALWEVIRSSGATIIELVPVAMTALLEHAATLPADIRAGTRLEWAMATGESVSPALVNRWLELFPAVPLVNAYGPTEAADDVCQFVVTKPLPPGARSVPIGTPLTNLTLYVLDEQLQLQPIGVPGEICVSGIGVGEGYWGDEARTRDRFVPNPYRDAHRGDVLYRTGDIGFWRADGVLECLSRVDDQVKIRGFRIELGEIEAALGQHPAVRDAVVLARGAGGDKRLAAYAVPNLSSAEVDAEIRQTRREQVALWKDLHEREYRETLDYGDPTFNVIGWDSTYTNQPLPIAEMHEYVDATVERILALQPRSILEIGCGSGLILFSLVPRVARYVGTDLSSVTIDRLRTLQQSAELRARIPNLDRAELRAGAADDLSSIEPGSIDTVIFPSVVQYFPGVDYLLDVLDEVFRVIHPDGAIFFGDIRSLPLLEHFHASVALFKADAGTSAAELIDRIQVLSANQQEMALAPAFFQALRVRYPAICDVEILPKQATAQNEMTRFRYDVVVRLGAPAAERRSCDWQRWHAAGWSTDAIERHLQTQHPGALALRDVSNARVRDQNALRRVLARGGERTTVADIRQAVADEREPGLEPDELRALGLRCGYDVHVSVSRQGADGRFDVAFTRRGAEAVLPLWLEPESADGWARYANNPLHERLARVFEPRLRDYLKARVPHYMVPPDLVMLERMPTTPAGKIDRQALPAPRRATFVSASVAIAPRTPTEQALAAIWCEVLAAEQCGVTDNFFDLGGHSLKATQVVSRIVQRLGVEIPLRAIFSSPTLEDLAALVDAASAGTRGGLIPRVPDAEHYPLSHAQRRLWILAQFDDGSVAYNMPASLRLDGPLDVSRLEAAFAAAVARHESLRTTFVVVDGDPRQRVNASLQIPLRVMDLSAAPDPGARANDAARRDAAAAFDLETGPLVRLALLRLGPDRHVLLVNIHHIVSDDWSVGVLIRDVMRAYDAATLATPRIQYRDFACWQNAALADAASQASRAYWLDRLSGDLPTLDLPSDFPRPAVKTYRGRALTSRLDADTVRALREVARAHQSTLFMTLLAAVNVLLHRYSSATDIIVASPVAGRDHPDLEDQIGFYINTLALRTQVRPGTSFGELLTEVTRNTTAAIEHQAYPFDRLVDELSIRRDPSRMPICDVTVVMTNTGGPQLTLPGVAVAPFADGHDVSKYDLHVVFDDREAVLEMSLVYNPDLFAEDRIQRMAVHLETLLRSAATDPRSAIERLAMRAPGEVERSAPHGTGRQPAMASPAEGARVAGAPNAEMEAVVSTVVRELLNVDRFGLTDNFFDLGAKSLMLIRAHALLQERLGRTFPLVALYQHTSVAALAAFLAGSAESGVDAMTTDADARAARRRAARGRSSGRGDRG